MASRAGWSTRATLHKEEFIPTSDDMLFQLLLSTPAQPEGFICAFFRPNIVVNSVGHVLFIPQEDFTGIVELSSEVCALPQTGSFRNTWRIKHPVTSQDIQRLLVKQEDGSLKETSVYGYTRMNDILDKPVGHFMALPAALMELFGVLQEAKIQAAGEDDNAKLVEEIRNLVK